MPPDFQTPGVYTQELASGHKISGVETSIVAFVGAAAEGPVETATVIQSLGDYGDSFGDRSFALPMSRQVRQFFWNGGSKAIIVRVAAAADGTVADAEICGDPDRRSGIHALETVDLFSLLCLCPSSSEIDLLPASWGKAADYCAGKLAMLLVDAPTAWSRAANPTGTNPTAAALAGIADLRAGITATANAALFFPHLHLAVDGSRDAAALDDALMGPSGTVAGVIAQFDDRGGLWKAATGTHGQTIGIKDLSCRLTEPQNEQLNALAINCLWVVPTYGPVIWGNRTLQGHVAGDWRYLPVRRLALYIEQCVTRGITWASVEANDEKLWSALRLSIGDFMQSLFSLGAFPGTTAQAAYFVRCDAQTTTQSDIDTGKVNITIGFAPLKPAEFVIIRLSQIVGVSQMVGKGA